METFGHKAGSLKRLTAKMVRLQILLKGEFAFFLFEEK